MAKVNLEFKDYSANILQFAVSEMIPQQEIQGLGSRLEVEENFSSLMRSMVYTLRASVAGNVKQENRIESVHVVKTPSSWWQMFKRDVMPTWFTTHYPVVFTVESVPVIVTLNKVQRVCPHLDLGSRHDCIRWVTFDNDKSYRTK